MDQAPAWLGTSPLALPTPSLWRVEFSHFWATWGIHLRLGPSSPSLHAPNCHQFLPAQAMPPGTGQSGRSYLGTSSTGEAGGASGAGGTLDGREDGCWGDPTSQVAPGFSGPGGAQQDVNRRNRSWCRVSPAVDLGVTYGGTSSTGSTVVTASALREGRHPLVMPTAAEVPPAPPGRGLVPAQTRYSQQGRRDRGGLSRREDHEDPGEGRGHVFVTKGDSLPFWGLLPPMCPWPLESILQ